MRDAVDLAQQPTASWKRAFYWRWIAANGWAESAGLGTTFVIGRSVAPQIDQLTGATAVVGAALLAVVLGTFLEGVVVGIAQEHVLRRRVAHLPRWSWTRATAAGAALAWVLGMVPSTIMALSTARPAPSTATEPPALVQYGLAMAMGLVAGPILGAAQWSALRRVVAHAGSWLWANATAWAVGMPIIFAGMDLVPWTAHPALVALAIYVVCAAAGLAVGAINGRILTKLLS